MIGVTIKEFGLAWVHSYDHMVIPVHKQLDKKNPGRRAGVGGDYAHHLTRCAQQQLNYASPVERGLYQMSQRALSEFSLVSGQFYKPMTFDWIAALGS